MQRAQCTKNRPGRPALVLAVLLFCAGAFYGCGGEKESPREKPLIGVLVYRQDDAYIQLVTRAITETLSGRAEVEVAYAEGDQMVQNEQIGVLLGKKADALALNIVDPQAAFKAVDVVKKAGIPGVFFNREPDLNSIKGHDKARFVGTNASDAGVMQGDIISDLWRRHPEYDRNGDGKFQYVMIQANLDNPEAIARTEYSVKQARALGVDMQQIGDTLFCNWDDALAYEAMSLVFPLVGDKLELVIANNDSMALGAVRVLNEFEYNLAGGDPARRIPVVGVDAVPAAVEAIRQGRMSGTVVQDGKAMGEAVALMMLNGIGGKDFLEGLPYAWDDSGIAIRIPYAPYTSED